MDSKAWEKVAAPLLNDGGKAAAAVAVKADEEEEEAESRLEGGSFRFLVAYGLTIPFFPPLFLFDNIVIVYSLLRFPIALSTSQAWWSLD